MKKLIFIFLLIPVLCSGQSFFWSHDCLRPTGLTDYSLCGSIQVSGGDSTYFAGNLTLAQDACHQATLHPSGLTLWCFCTQASSLTVGVRVYNDISCVSSRNCTYLPTGYYLYNVTGFTYQIVYVVNGIIQSVTNCL